MKKLFLLTIIFASVAYAANADYYYQNSGSLNNPSYNTYSNIGNTYYSGNQNKPSYQVSGNNIYGSDGSHYSKMGNTIQNTSTGETYQINGNMINKIH